MLLHHNTCYLLYLGFTDNSESICIIETKQPENIDFLIDFCLVQLFLKQTFALYSIMPLMVPLLMISDLARKAYFTQILGGGGGGYLPKNRINNCQIELCKYSCYVNS